MYPMATLILPLSHHLCPLRLCTGRHGTHRARDDHVGGVYCGTRRRSGEPACEGCAWATAPVYAVCRDTSGEKCWHGLVGSSVAPCPYEAQRSQGEREGERWSK